MTTADAPAATPEIRACQEWAHNGLLIADVAQLGYLTHHDHVIDPTYGYGVWWSVWRPSRLTAHDLNPAKAPDGPADFRDLPYPRASFTAAAFDPPYKLNGTPSEDGPDERFGVDEAATVAQRMGLIFDGMTELARVLTRRGILLVKCQDQVVSGSVYWQTDEITAHAASLGFVKVDRFDLLGGGRPQPDGRRQVHARYRPSTLLVFQGRRDRPMGQQALEL